MKNEPAPLFSLSPFPSHSPPHTSLSTHSLRQDCGCHPKGEVVHSFHQPQDVLGSVFVLLLLPCLVEQFCWLDLGKEAEVNDGQLPSNFFRVKIKHAQHWTRIGWKLEERKTMVAIKEEVSKTTIPYLFLTFSSYTYTQLSLFPNASIHQLSIPSREEPGPWTSWHSSFVSHPGWEKRGRNGRGVKQPCSWDFRLP